MTNHCAQISVRLFTGGKKKRTRAILIDEAIANLVCTINHLPGIMTYTACQGTNERPAYIFLSWRSSLARKKLRTMVPHLMSIGHGFGVAVLDVPGTLRLSKQKRRLFANSFID